MMKLEELKQCIAITRELSQTLSRLSITQNPIESSTELEAMKKLFAKRDELFRNLAKSMTDIAKREEFQPILQELVQLETSLYNQLCQERSVLFGSIKQLKLAKDYNPEECKPKKSKKY